MSRDDVSSILNLQAPDINFRLLLIIPLPNQVSDEQIEYSLLWGLKHLYQKNPILRFWAIKSTDDSSKYALCEPLTLARIEEWTVGKSKLHVADSSFPSFQSLKEQGATLNLLDDSNLGPRPKGVQNTGPHPVFDFKATKIEGGLVLCFLVLHKVLDGTSTGTIIRQFTEGSKRAFNGSPDDHVTFLGDDLGRETQQFSISLMPIDSPITPAPYRRLSHLSNPTHNLNGAMCKLFKLSAPSVVSLKTICSDGQQSFISTNDAVSALIMHALTRARKVDPWKHPEVGAHFPVNIRSKLLPPIQSYELGNFVLCARASIPTSQALSTDVPALAATAATIRKGIVELNHQRIQQILSWVSAQPDNAMSIDWLYLYYGDPGVDYGLISWANMGLYNLDFGFGKPEFVRIPGDFVFSGSCRIMPRLSDGAQEIIMGLTKNEMRALEKDQLWNDWVEAYPIDTGSD